MIITSAKFLTAGLRLAFEHVTVRKYIALRGRDLGGHIRIMLTIALN